MKCGRCEIITTGKVCSYLARTEHVVQVLEEGLLLDFVVCEDERDSLTSASCHSIQVLEVVHQVGSVVRSMICG